MNQTKKHIIYLLERRGVVDIPGLGVLSSNRRAAAFDGNHLLAPGTIISFCSDEESADSQELVNSMARAQEISKEEAEQNVCMQLGDIRHELNTKGESQLGSLGSFEMRNGIISFTQSAYSGAGMKYPVIDLQPIKIEKTKKESLPPYITEENRDDFMRSLRRTASSAAAIAIFAFIVFIVSQIPGRQQPAQQASFAIENKAAQTSLRPVSLTATEKEDAPMIVVFNTPADASCEVEYANESTAPSATDHYTEQKASSARYCLVVASLANKKEADAYMSMSNDDLRLLEKDGRFRVYILEANTPEALVKQANDADIYSSYPSAWVCRK